MRAIVTEAAPVVRQARQCADAFWARLVTWQEVHGRSSLPWQNTRDPYRVWLSEIMLQQTQVSTVLGYYERFLARCPTVAELAGAPEDEVMGLWSGLGYYSRARNLHRCAQEVVARFGGKFPHSAELLQTLPGIGRSTAAAIAAFCFGERVSIMDGNVKRVLSRLLAFDADLASGANEKLLWKAADELLPPEGDTEAISRYTQGLMDLGATVCLPRQPQCLICPVEALCEGRRQGDPARLPVKTRKLKRSSQSLWLLLARSGNGKAVWLQKRPATGIWAGLHALPVFDSAEALEDALPTALRPALRHLPAFLHVLTHKDLHLHPVEVDAARSEMAGLEGRWVAAEDWPALGLPAPVRRLLEERATRIG